MYISCRIEYMLTETNDLTLLKNTLDGDTSAFGIIIDKYKDYIYDLMLRMTGNFDDAADLTQETFLKAYKELKKFKIEYKFSNWLYTIALNLARNFLRRKKLVSFLSLDFKKDDEETLVIPVADKTYSNLESENKEELAKKMFEKLTMSLSPSLRAAFILRYKHNLSVDDISKTLQIPPATAKVKLHRARNYLFSKFKDKVDETLRNL